MKSGGGKLEPGSTREAAVKHTRAQKAHTRARGHTHTTLARNCAQTHTRADTHTHTHTHTAHTHELTRHTTLRAHTNAHRLAQSAYSTHNHMRACMFACIHACVHVCVHVCVCARVYAYACVHVCVCLCLCACVYVYTCECMHVQLVSMTMYACMCACMFANSPEPCTFNPQPATARQRR